MNTIYQGRLRTGSDTFDQQVQQLVNNKNFGEAIKPTCIGGGATPLRNTNKDYEAINAAISHTDDNNSVVNDDVVRTLSQSFIDRNKPIQLSDNIVKSLGKSYFAERAGLIGDIINQVEKDRNIDKEKAENIKKALNETPLAQKVKQEEEKKT